MSIFGQCLHSLMGLWDTSNNTLATQEGELNRDLGNPVKIQQLQGFTWCLNRILTEYIGFYELIYK